MPTAAELIEQLPPFEAPQTRMIFTLAAYEQASGLHHERDSGLVVASSLLSDLRSWCEVHGVEFDLAVEVSLNVRASDAFGVELT